MCSKEAFSGLDGRSLIPGRDIYFCLAHHIHSGSGTCSISHAVGTQEQSGRNLKLYTYLHLVLKFRIRDTLKQTDA